MNLKNWIAQCNFSISQFQALTSLHHQLPAPHLLAIPVYFEKIQPREKLRSEITDCKALAEREWLLGKF